MSDRDFPLDLLAPDDSHFEYAAEATNLTSIRGRRGLSLAHNLATEAFDDVRRQSPGLQVNLRMG